MIRKSVCLSVIAVLIAMGLSGCLESAGDPEPDGGSDEPDSSQADGPGVPDNETDGSDPDMADNETAQEDPSNGDGDNETEEDESDGNGTVHYDPGWPQIDGAGIRPGVSIAGGCTANFIFSSPDNQTLYIGTASHCVGGQSLNASINIAGITSGTLVYCSWMHTEGESSCPASENNLILDYNDFALIEIPAGDREAVHPALLHWGGPTALGTTPAIGDKTLSYGNSKPDVLRPIEGHVIQTSSVYTTMYAIAPGIPGDSGSPVIGGDGESVGILIGLGLAPFPASNAVTNLDHALGYMKDKTGLDVELKTWELLESGLLP